MAIVSYTSKILKMILAVYEADAVPIIMTHMLAVLQYKARQPTTVACRINSKYPNFGRAMTLETL